MLQKVLPHLRPKQHGSIAARERLELLLQNWTLSAWHMAGKPSASAAPHLVPFTPTISVTPKQRQNFKAKLPDDVWDLVESADSKERPRLVQLVCKLATPGRRVELLAMCGGQFERADSVEQASRPSSPTTCEAQPVPASPPNRMISGGGQHTTLVHLPATPGVYLPKRGDFSLATGHAFVGQVARV